MSYLLRRTYREGGKVNHGTMANLSPVPAEAIDAVRSALGFVNLNRLQDDGLIWPPLMGCSVGLVGGDPSV